jgi:hypothetical protein
LPSFLLSLDPSLWSENPGIRAEYILAIVSDPRVDSYDGALRKVIAGDLDAALRYDTPHR